MEAPCGQLSAELALRAERKHVESRNDTRESCGTVGRVTAVTGHSGFSEQREKGRLPWRPFVGRSDVSEARRHELVDHNARRDAMSAPIGWHTLGNLISAAILEDR